MIPIFLSEMRNRKDKRSQDGKNKGAARAPLKCHNGTYIQPFSL